MRQLKSDFSSFPDAVLLQARDVQGEEIKVRMRRCELEYQEKMKLAITPNDRAKLTHLIQIRRAQAAAQIVALKLMDEIIAKREQGKNTEVVWVDDQDIVFVEEPRA